MTNMKKVREGRLRTDEDMEWIINIIMSVSLISCLPRFEARFFYIITEDGDRYVQLI